MSNDLISFDSPPNLISFDDNSSRSAAVVGASSTETPKREAVRTSSGLSSNNLLDRSPFHQEDQQQHSITSSSSNSSTVASNHSPTTSTSSCTNLDDDLLANNNQTLAATSTTLVTPVTQMTSKEEDSSLSFDMNLESLGILSDIFTRSDLDTEDTWLCSPEELRLKNQSSSMSTRRHEFQDMTNTASSRVETEKQNVTDWLKMDSDVDMRKLLVHLTDLCDRRIRSRNSNNNNNSVVVSTKQQIEPIKPQLDQLLSIQMQTDDKKASFKRDDDNQLITSSATNSSNNINDETVILSSSSSSSLSTSQNKKTSAIISTNEPSPSSRSNPDNVKKTTRSLDFVDLSSTTTNVNSNNDVNDPLDGSDVNVLPLPVTPLPVEQLQEGPEAMELSNKDIYSAMIALVRDSVGKDWPHEKVANYARQVIQRVTGQGVINDAIVEKYNKRKDTTWKSVASSRQTPSTTSVQPVVNNKTVASSHNRTSSVTRPMAVPPVTSNRSNGMVQPNQPTPTTKRRPVMAYGSQRSLTASVVSSSTLSKFQSSQQQQQQQQQHSALPSHQFKNSSSSYQMKHKHSTSNISDISSISSGYASNNTSPNGNNNNTNWSNMTTSSSLHQMPTSSNKKMTTNNASIHHQSRLVVSTPRTSHQQQVNNTSKQGVMMMPPPQSPRTSRPRAVVAQSPSVSQAASAAGRKSTSSSQYQQDVSLTRKSFIPLPAATSSNKSHSVTRGFDVSPIRSQMVVDTPRVKGVRVASSSTSVAAPTTNGWWHNDPEIF